MTIGNICKCCKNINPNSWTITWSVFIFSPNKLRLVKQVGAMWRPEKQKHHVQLLRFSIFQSLSPRADTSVKCFIYTRAMVKFCGDAIIFFESDIIPMFFGHTLPSLLLRLFQSNHRRPWYGFFTIFGWFSCLPKVLSWSSCFLFGFHGRSRYFHVFFYFFKFTIANNAIFNLINH